MRWASREMLQLNLLGGPVAIFDATAFQCQRHSGAANVMPLLERQSFAGRDAAGLFIKVNDNWTKSLWMACLWENFSTERVRRPRNRNPATPLWALRISSAIH